jgi:hypothetical protein
MIRRSSGIAVFLASALIAGPQGTTSVVGTISSSEPITINGTEMSPAAAPSWPLAGQDEIANSGPALLKTADRNSLILDAQSRARVAAAGNGFAYIYVRQGGVRFNATAGPVYICIGDRLFVPAKSAQGSLKVDPSGSVARSLDRGSFVEQGVRPCTSDVPADFLSGLPQAAGGSIGPAGGAAGGGVNRTSIAVLGIAAAAAAGLGFIGASAPCAGANGCNFNPASISPILP